MARQWKNDASPFSAAEVEFLAEDELINIVPNVRMDALHMICGDFGPFRPQIPTQVPLRLAIGLKKRGKCRIQQPEWMTAENLTRTLEEERVAHREFQPLPFHYVEISRLLFEYAEGDMPEAYLVKSLIEDIRNVRFHKVESGMEALKEKTDAVKLKSLGAMEVNLIRPFMTRALQCFYKLDNEVYLKQPATATDSQTSLPRRTLRPR